MAQPTQPKDPRDGQDGERERLPANPAAREAESDLPVDRLTKPDLYVEAMRFRSRLNEELASRQSRDEQWGRNFNPGGYRAAVLLSRIYKVDEVHYGPAGKDGALAITPRMKIGYHPHCAYDPYDKESHRAAHQGLSIQPNYIDGSVTIEFTEKGLRISSDYGRFWQEFPNNVRAVADYLSACLPHDWTTENQHYRLESGFYPLEGALESDQPFNGSLTSTGHYDEHGVIKSKKDLEYHLSFGRMPKLLLRDRDGGFVGIAFDLEVELKGGVSGVPVLKNIKTFKGYGERFNKKVKEAAERALRDLI